MQRPPARLLAFVLAASVAVGHVPSASAGSGLDEATAAWKSLSADSRRRQLRHHWTRVIEGLEQASKSLPACGAGQLGLLRAARAAEELAGISYVKEDRAAAAAKYVVAAERCPKGRLADDAWLDAGRLKKELGDVEGARAAWTKAVAVKGDMRRDAAKALASLPPPAPREAESLAKATEAFARLKADRKARYYRHNWLKAIRAFERAGQALAPKRDGAVAYMRGAKASEELSRISKKREDAERAVRLYVAAADRCPNESLVDDALLEAATIELHRLGNPETARGYLERAIAFDGDMKNEARRLLAKLPPKPRKAAPKPAPAVAVKPPEPEPEDENEPVSPDELLAATFGEPTDELGALMERVDTFTRPEERKDVASTVRDLRQDALGGDLSVSEQIGLKIRRIVLDAGHGGHDSGAVGPNGVLEKDVTLAITKALAKELRGRGYEVVLTRDSDTFIALEERTTKANEVRGDLFISIHANAHTRRNRGGVETYTLNTASDRFAMRLAARENASSERSVGDLQFLLADLATRANTADSDRLARFVQTSLVERIRLNHGQIRDLGVKHALFYVLLGARMPAILVETAFVSNPREEKWLKTPAFQRDAAAAIADGVDRFVERRQHLASAVP